MIICSKCNIPKENELFHWKNKKKGKRQSVCIDCKKGIDNNHYATNETRRKKLRANANASIKRNKRFVRLLKMLLKCSKCGDKRWYVLDFHHVGKKEKEIGDMIRRGTSLENLKKELRKCIVLCSNCHREEHYLNGKVAEMD